MGIPPLRMGTSGVELVGGDQFHSPHDEDTVPMELAGGDVLLVLL